MFSGALKAVTINATNGVQRPFLQRRGKRPQAVIRLLRQQEGAFQAKKVLQKCKDACFSLSDMPHRGSHPKELLSLGINEYRELHASPYRIIYTVANNEVLIVAVSDGRRNMREFLKQRALGRQDI